jgi:hypothetical protein
LRGLLSIDPAVKPGYEQLRYTVHITGAALEQFEEFT